MKFLKKAENKMSYAKIGLYGDQGSGKTVTAAKIAIGLYKYAKLTKPVGMFDTEPAASFIKPLFDKANIEFLVYDQSRALKDLMGFMDEAENECSVIIIDSITHIWRDAQESYLKKINQSRKTLAEQKGWKFKPINQIEFQDWRHIKSNWYKFTDRFLTSKVHCIVCGRSGTIYEYQENERTGKKELITTGTKMATEKELGYEPSLLVEMSKIIGKDTPLINRAFVEKDRNVTDPLTGKSFNFPDFHHFKPHIDFLNLGGKHFDSMDQRDSADMYTETGEDDWSQEKRQREGLLEELNALLTKHDLSGTAKDTQKKRILILEEFFGTSAKTKLEHMPSHKLKDYYNNLKMHLENPIDTNEDVPQ